MNGNHPFRFKDLIIINRIFGITLESLIPTMIPQLEQRRLKETLAKIKKSSFHSKLKLTKNDLAFL